MALSRNTCQHLRKVVGKDNFSQDKEDCACYAYDATGRMFLPEAVLFVKDSQEISSVLSLANQEQFFVIPRGAGSNMTGGSLAVRGGVVLVTTRMNKILEIDQDNLIAHVESGVITGRFHKAVEEKGLFYPPDPASSDISTLGGNVAECAGGPRAVKYGVTRDYVLGLELVLPTGNIIKTGVKTAKGVAGYDLTRLIVGSEGTLGIITRITLRLLPLPKVIRTMTATFDRMEHAAETVSKIIKSAIIPRTVEYMDNASLKCVEDYLSIGLPVEADAMLLIEADGEMAEVDDAMDKVRSICSTMGAISVDVAETENQREKLWKARKSISPALYRLGPDKINEDIVVPRNRIPNIVRKIRSLMDNTGLPMASFGHAGDGNIHFNVMIDKKNEKELSKATEVIEALFDYTLELGGTISGEHGIGITKAPYLKKEIGKAEQNLMKNIKNIFDPKGILNPGKIFDS